MDFPNKAIDIEAVKAQIVAIVKRTIPSTIVELKAHNVDGSFVEALFTSVARDVPDIDGCSFAVDLSEARLMDMTKDQFLAGFVAMASKPLCSMRVRFGWDLFVPYFQAAMSEAPKGVADRVETMCIFAPTSTEVIAQMRKQEAQLRKDEDRRAKDREEYEERRRAEDAKRDKMFMEMMDSLRVDRDSTLNIQRDVKAGIDVDARLLEKGVAAAIAKAVNGHVLRVRYSFQTPHFSGDMDCLVEGETGDKPIVVIAECKRNLDSKNNCREAFNQVVGAASNWGRLVASLEDGEPDPDLQADVEALQVARLKDHEVVFAFGSDIVTDNTVDFFSKKNFRGTEYFLVKPDDDGKYVKV